MSEQHSTQSSQLSRSTRIIYAVFDFVEECNKTKISAGLIVLVIAAVAASGLTIIKKEEQGVQTRFGKIIKTEMGPGIHYRVPFIDQIYTRKVKRIMRHNISSQGNKQVNFTILSGDSYLLEIDLSLQYKIGNLKEFLFASSDPIQLMAMLTREILINIIGSNFVDLIFTANRNIIQTRLFEEVTEHLRSHGIGVELVALHIVGIRPIAEMVDAFRDVNDAIAEKIEAVNNARTKQERLLAHSRGQADALVTQAKARAQERVVQSKASAGAFLALLAEYQKQPHHVAITRYWQRMRTIFTEASLSAVGPQNSPIAINIIEDGAGFTPVDMPSGSALPSGGSALNRPLFSTASRNPYVIENPDADKMLMDGHFHNRHKERDHMHTAKLRSLIFDSPALFSHDHVTRQGGAIVEQQAQEKPMVEVLDQNREKKGGKTAAPDKKAKGKASEPKGQKPTPKEESNAQK